MLLVLLYRLRSENKEYKEELEGTYLIRNTDLMINGKSIKITYCVPYRKRNEHKHNQVTAIRLQLVECGYGTPTFNERMFRDQLRKYEYRNIRITTN